MSKPILFQCPKLFRLPSQITGENGAYVNPADIDCIRVYKETNGLEHGMPVGVRYVVVITTKYDHAFRYPCVTLEQANKFQEKIAKLVRDAFTHEFYYYQRLANE